MCVVLVGSGEEVVYGVGFDDVVVVYDDYVVVDVGDDVEVVCYDE